MKWKWYIYLYNKISFSFKITLSIFTPLTFQKFKTIFEGATQITRVLKSRYNYILCVQKNATIYFRLRSTVVTYFWTYTFIIFFRHQKLHSFLSKRLKNYCSFLSWYYYFKYFNIFIYFLNLYLTTLLVPANVSESLRFGLVWLACLDSVSAC